jgi:transposase-like protein
MTTPTQKLRDVMWLEAAYHDHSCHEIARALDCSATTVHYWLRKHRIPTRNTSEATHHHNTPRTGRLADRSWLEAAYREHSPYAVAVKLGCSAETVRRWLHKHKIPTRNKSEASQLFNARRSERHEYGRSRRTVTGAAHHPPGVLRLPAGDFAGVGR